ncbi:MAG: superoxide dismutase [Candidatus Thalassarchaeaceae archaeon]
MPFDLPDLNYAYSDLEPHLDATTMEIHHSKHHAGYTRNLNSAIDGTSMADQDIEEILSKCAGNPAVRNNGGGYWNHCFFWDSMCPPDQSLGPSGALMDAINDAFGSFEEFKSKFKAAALTRFGSGWAWLCSDSGILTICSTANQDNPLMETVGCGQTPILGIDVWEHAYYKKFGPGRGDYVEAWWNVVNWTKVEDRFNSTIQ